MKFLIIFIILSIINVVFSTVRSITTIKSGKTIASLISGGYFAFYNIMLIYTVANFPMWQKCLITFICNVAGVWIVKFIEEKMRKDKLWLVKMTVPAETKKRIVMALGEYDISNSQIEITGGDYVCFDCYCKNKSESKWVFKIAELYGGKTFATENKIF